MPSLTRGCSGLVVPGTGNEFGTGVVCAAIWGPGKCNIMILEAVFLYHVKNGLIL